MPSRKVKELDEDEYLAEVAKSRVYPSTTVDLGPVVVFQAKHTELGDVVFINNSDGKHAIVHS